MFPLIILYICEKRKVSKSGFSGKAEIQNFPGPHQAIQQAIQQAYGTWKSAKFCPVPSHPP